MKRATREFLEKDEAVRAAKSKDRKREERKRRERRFGDWIREKAERLEMNGNPAAAQHFRKEWGRMFGVSFPGHPEIAKRVRR